ncbi:unnamed protein product [Spodoptera littoralis]|uniref:Uncharacterized protein n=1 Tax=Spodoptera littoralis TaxID=7109 RepID=A0A9P0N478_SPOLI|nr:unnamed protein product [Spodoptera littoralis]CAH1639279.1 unnamed protein product [Spodoptera littoralis]
MSVDAAACGLDVTILIAVWRVERPEAHVTVYHGYLHVTVYHGYLHVLPERLDASTTLYHNIYMHTILFRRNAVPTDLCINELTTICVEVLFGKCKITTGN